MLSLNKCLLVIFTIALFSCGENSALKEETHYFQAENKDWITSDGLGDNFILIDNNGISYSFVMSVNNHEFTKSWGSFMGINTDMTHTEYHYQAYTSNYRVPFSLSLTAGFEPYGDDTYIELAGIGFAYDFKFETVSRISTDYGNKSKSMTDKGYEIQDEDIYSTVEILDTLSTNYHNYEDVLYFQLNDFQNSIDDFDCVKIYIAKNIGLIKYELKSGIVYERK